MIPQPDGFALHFEIPAVLHHLLPQVAISGDGTGPVFVPGVRDLLARRLALLEEPLETTADARQCRGALLLELLEETLVLGAGVVDSHGPILRDLPQVLQLDSPARTGEYRAFAKL